MRPLALTCLMTLVFVASGCATSIRGTTQALTVATDPDGASCTLATLGEKDTYEIAATPGTVEVARSAKPLQVTCAKPGRLDVVEEFKNIGGAAADTEEQRMQGVGGVVLGAGAAAGVGAAVGATVGATGALLAASAVGIAQLAILPVMLVTYAVDTSSGAAYGYPPAIVLLLPPATFPDTDSHEAYFSALEEEVLSARKEARRKVEEDCSFLTCESRLYMVDAEVDTQLKRIASLRERTHIAPAGELPSMPAPTAESPR